MTVWASKGAERRGEAGRKSHKLPLDPFLFHKHFSSLYMSTVEGPFPIPPTPLGSSKILPKGIFSNITLTIFFFIIPIVVSQPCPLQRKHLCQEKQQRCDNHQLATFEVAYTWETLCSTFERCISRSQMSPFRACQGQESEHWAGCCQRERKWNDQAPSGGRPRKLINVSHTVDVHWGKHMSDDNWTSYWCKRWTSNVSHEMRHIAAAFYKIL